MDVAPNFCTANSPQAPRTIVLWRIFEKVICSLGYRGGKWRLGVPGYATARSQACGGDTCRWVCAGGARRLQHMPGPETKGQGRQSPSDRARLRAAPATLLRNWTWRSQVCKSQPTRNCRACFLRRKKALAVYFQTRQRRFARVASRRNAKRQRKAS